MFLSYYTLYPVAIVLSATIFSSSISTTVVDAVFTRVTFAFAIVVVVLTTAADGAFVVATTFSVDVTSVFATSFTYVHVRVRLWLLLLFYLSQQLVFL